MMEQANNFNEQPQNGQKHDDFNRPKRKVGVIDKEVQPKISNNSVYRTMEAKKLDNSPFRKWVGLSKLEKVIAVFGFVTLFYIVGIVVSSILFL